MEATEEVGEDALRKRVIDLLAARQVLPTPQRVSVGEFLFSKRQHVSAEQVLTALRAQSKAVSKATVYNTLNLFVERGLLRTVHIDSTRVVYDPTCKPHHHILDVTSGELTDVPFDAVGIDKMPQLPPGKVVDAVEVIIKVRSPS